MGIQHAYTQTVADGTATSVVRPSDWNSAHKVNYALGGNTVGSASVSGLDVALFGGNNITLSADTANSRLHISGPNTTQFLTTAALSNHSHAFATTTTTGASIIVGTTNSAGVTIGVPAFLTTAQSPGAYLTTARASNDAIGLNTALTANGVAWTVNSSGLSLNIPAFLTTAAVSTHSHGNPTLALTNLSGTTASASNGFTLSLSAAAGGGGADGGNTIAAAGSTAASTGAVVFSNSNNVSFGLNGATMTASASYGTSGSILVGGNTVGGLSVNNSFSSSLVGIICDGALSGGIIDIGGSNFFYLNVNPGAAPSIGGYELFPLGNNTVFSTLGQNSIYFQKFIAQDNISFNNIEIRVSGSTVSSTNSQVAAHSYDYGLYERETGTNDTRYSLIASSRIWFQASFNSNTAAGWTVSQGTASVTNTSAGTANLSALSGFKHLYMPFTSTITAGGEYAVAMRMSSATTVGTSPLRLGVKEMTNYSNLSIGRIGVTEGFSVSSASFVGDFAQGVYSATSSNLPSTLARSGLTNAVSHARKYIQFEV